MIRIGRFSLASCERHSALGTGALMIANSGLAQVDPSLNGYDILRKDILLCGGPH